MRDKVQIEVKRREVVFQRENTEIEESRIQYERESTSFHLARGWRNMCKVKKVES